MQLENINNILKESGVKFALAVTGSCATGATDFFRYTGASYFIEDIEIPYSQAASERLIQKNIKNFRSWKEKQYKVVSQEYAITLAEAMWRKNFENNEKEVGISIGVSGKLKVENQREDRQNIVYYSIFNPYLKSYKNLSLELSKDLSREEQEFEASRKLHSLILEEAQLTKRLLVSTKK